MHAALSSFEGANMAATGPRTRSRRASHPHPERPHPGAATPTRGRARRGCRATTPRADCCGADSRPRATSPSPIVVAPAGAGKTLGVAGWLATSSRDVDTIWYDATRMTTVEHLRQVLDRAATVDGLPLLVVVDDAHLLSGGLRPPGQRAPGLRPGRPAPGPADPLGPVDLASRPRAPRPPHDPAWRRPAAHPGGEHRRWPPSTPAPPAPEILEAVVDRSERLVRCPGPGRSSQCHHARRARTRPSSSRRRARPSRTSWRERSSWACVPRSGTSCSAWPASRTSPSELARHLTRDPQAGEALDSLETTGLLVNRVSADLRAADAEERYRIHPAAARGGAPPHGRRWRRRPAGPRDHPSRHPARSGPRPDLRRPTPLPRPG